MTEEDLIELLQRLTDSATEPELAEADLDDLVGVAARPDEDGLFRGDADWTPTWDVNAAAAEGWLRKAGRAATKFNFAEDSHRFDRAQIYLHCRSQHTLYAGKGMGTLT